MRVLAPFVFLVVAVLAGAHAAGAQEGAGAWHDHSETALLINETAPEARTRTVSHNWTEGPREARIEIAPDIQTGVLVIAVYDAADETVFEEAFTTSDQPDVGANASGAAAGNWQVTVWEQDFRGNYTILIRAAADVQPTEPPGPGFPTPPTTPRDPDEGTPALSSALLLASIALMLAGARRPPARPSGPTG